jgi:beta-N-acetylhexosaminidase
MGDLRGLELQAEEADWLEHPLIGGLIFFARNFEGREQIRALIAQVRAIRPDILLAVDTEGGRVQRFRAGFVDLPPLAMYGQIWEQDRRAAAALAELGGYVLGAELAPLDIDMPFSPVLDLDGGVSAIIGDRALHARPAVVAELAAAHLRGLRRAQVATTAKHFPGHGAVAPDSHVELPVDGRDLAQILEQDLAPYRSCMPLLDSVMAAHVVYPEVDPMPASFSSSWLQGILREQMGFAGAIFADDLNMGGAQAQGDIVARASQAFAAGCDMLPVCNAPDDLVKLLDGWQCPQLARGEQRLQALRRGPGRAGLAEDQRADFIRAVGQWNEAL